MKVGDHMIPDRTDKLRAKVQQKELYVNLVNSVNMLQSNYETNEELKTIYLQTLISLKNFRDK